MQGQGKVEYYTDIFSTEDLSSKFYGMQKKLLDFFNFLGLKNKKIILAVSGGADSMIMTMQILYFFHKNNLSLDNIHIAHCNHKIRNESDKEMIFLSKFFSGLNFHIFERDKGGHEDENSLRIRRYSQFSSLQRSIGASYIFLGHHLNDRVESTFLHLIRGAGIDGFLNMHHCQEHPLMPNGCLACRPLLSFSKEDIITLCKECKIPYFEDYTNQDISISKRNRVRHNIINPLSHSNGSSNHFLQSFANIYKELEENEKFKSKSFLINQPSFPSRNADFSYLWGKNISSCDENDIKQLRKDLGLNIQISMILLNEWKTRINTGKNSFKRIGGCYFFIHENHLYIIKAKEKFWENNNLEPESIIKIKNIDLVDFYGYKLEIPRDELIGGFIRLPKNGDKFAGRSWNRRALNHKIPMWRRNWIPLAIKDGKVIHMRKNIRK